MIYEKVNGVFQIVPGKREKRPEKTPPELKKTALAIVTSNNWRHSQELMQICYSLKMFHNKEGKPAEGEKPWATVCKEIFGDHPDVQTVNIWLRPYEQLLKRYTDGKPERVKDEEGKFKILKYAWIKNKFIFKFKIPGLPKLEFIGIRSLKKK
jgi:hypothetical protein